MRRRTDTKEAWRRWWRREMELPRLVGMRLTRRVAAKLAAFWTTVFAAGAGLWAFGLNGYSFVALGAVWLSGAWLMPELLRSTLTREED